MLHVVSPIQHRPDPAVAVFETQICQLGNLHTGQRPTSLLMSEMVKIRFPRGMLATKACFSSRLSWFMMAGRTIISGMYWNLQVATGAHFAWSLPVPLRAIALSFSSWPLRILTSTMGAAWVSTLAPGRR